MPALTQSPAGIGSGYRELGPGCCTRVRAFRCGAPETLSSGRGEPRTAAVCARDSALVLGSAESACCGHVRARERRSEMPRKRPVLADRERKRVFAAAIACSRKAWTRAARRSLTAVRGSDMRFTKKADTEVGRYRLVQSPAATSPLDRAATSGFPWPLGSRKERRWNPKVPRVGIPAG
jgi:hypothetical protein